ncbi:MAG: PEP/pyruvate-binding domain-containing protein [Pseudomonadota bacterium]
MSFTPLVLPLAAPVPSIEAVGGKTRALIRASEAGLPVPPGFCITTACFQEFLRSAGVDAATLAEIRTPGAAEGLRKRLSQAPLPATVVSAIVQAQADLGTEALAVRSSATAEDLPEASFAGQQETFLNVRGRDALLDAVVGCWLSLYSERAIAYRERFSITPETVAMAVLVQTLVPARAAGVLFTANPNTGARSELLVNVGLGLGETVVSGTVTPDSYVLSRPELTVLSRQLGSKERRLDPASDGGLNEQTVPVEKQAEPALSNRELTAVAKLGLAAEAAAGGIPQDVEFAVSDQGPVLLQSRPITQLPTEAHWEPPPGAKHLFRRQVVENMAGPLSPLFEDLYLTNALDRSMNELIRRLGLAIRLEEFVETPMFMTVNGYAYSRIDLQGGWQLTRLIPKVLWFYVTQLPGLLRTLVERWQKEGLPDYLAVIERWRELDPEQLDNRSLVTGVRELTDADAAYWGYVTMMVGAAKISEELLRRFLASRWVRAETSTGALLRGFSSETLAVEDALKSLADAVPEALAASLRSVPVNRLFDTLETLPGGRELAGQLRDHIAGRSQQIFDLDFCETTLSEQPEPVLQAFLQLLTKDRGAVRDDFSLAREHAERNVEARLGPLRRRVFVILLGWARRYGPNREAALGYVGFGWPVLRRLALTLGQRLVAAGVLTDADDVFYLTGQEFEDAEGLLLRGKSLRTAISDRRKLRQARARLHAPARVPERLRLRLGPFDITRFMEPWETQKRGNQDAGHIEGFAVSPGVVTAEACLIASPADFGRMRPGAILVCPTTTPAWTPLFVLASGLVTDIGGVLAHGSIVAREYGIPAVLGTGNGTQLIRDGEVITVDGSKGIVERASAR